MRPTIAPHSKWTSLAPLRYIDSQGLCDVGDQTRDTSSNWICLHSHLSPNASSSISMREDFEKLEARFFARGGKEVFSGSIASYLSSKALVLPLLGTVPREKPLHKSKQRQL